MDEAKPDDKIRKTITLTHKQAGLTGVSITTVFAALHFLSANYASKSDVKSLSEQLTDVKTIAREGFRAQSEMLVVHTTEEMHKHERIVDTLRKEIGDEKADRIRDDEGNTKRIDLVMELFKIKKTKTN